MINKNELIPDGFVLIPVIINKKSIATNQNSHKNIIISKLYTGYTFY